MARRQPEIIRGAAKSAWQLFAGATLWRIGLAITLVLHLAILLLPHSILAWNGTAVRLYLLEGTGFVFGVLALTGWLAVMRQHISRTTTSARATLSELADCILLSLLCTAIVSGLVTAILYRWGSSWATSTLAPYMTSLARGAPEMPLIVEMPFLVRLHVASWFAVIALVPFTSASMIIVALLDRAVMWINRPIHAIARGGRRAMVRLSPARWLWPEEDALDNRVDNAHKHS
jgi:nitrate reductase gamma subunit